MTVPLARSPLILVALAAIPLAAHGHVLDEYLQSTLVVIEPGDIRIRMNLTPGIEIAGQVLSQIDASGDGTISTDESEAYAKTLKQDLTVRLDARDTQLKLVHSNFPELAELHTGHGIIQLEFLLTPCSFPAGTHRLTFENRHFDSLGVYLFNAARPQSASIRVVTQNRNVNQSIGEIEFAFSASNSITLPAAGIFASVGVVVAGMLAALRRRKRASTNVPAL